MLSQRYFFIMKLIPLEIVETSAIQISLQNPVFEKATEKVLPQESRKCETNVYFCFKNNQKSKGVFLFLFSPIMFVF